ncbi:metallophosphoesterase family protein [Pseudothermotoga sp. U03pept]|uniref:metallophosphoesterase family protein n=1 Tax=Pseudothermotoga sp. U03pept TaxID=3447012 RepID=UPI003EFFBBD6
MKILHTSDWHLGLESWMGSRAVDRLEETKNSLSHLVEIAEKEKVEVVLITGDVLHKKNAPRIEVLNVLSEIVSSFARIAPTFLVMGNHDWQGLKTWNNLPVKNLFVVDRPDQVTLEKIKIFFLPYVDPQRLLGMKDDPLAAAGEYLNNFLVQVRNQIDETKINILAGHLLIEGLIESDEESSIGVQIKKSVIPTGLNYVALGHIHNRSVVQQSPLTCYAGSPIALDFGEEKDNKGAIVVEFEKDRVRVHQINTPRKSLKTFSVLDYSEDALRSLTKELKSFDGYARVIFDSHPSDEVRRYLMENFECVVKVQFKKSERQSQQPSIVTREKVDILQLYDKYVKGRFGETEVLMVDLVKKILKEVEEDQTNQY